MKIKLLLIASLLIVSSAIFMSCSKNSVNYEKLNESESLEYQDNGEAVNEDNSAFLQRDEAIEDYLLTQKAFSWKTANDSQNICVFENLGSKDDLFPLSLWVHCQEYKIEGENVLELSGFSGPVLVNYPNELSYFSVDKFTHQSPRDGSLYGEDVKKIFPNDVQDRIFN
jgi:hypothetical protein